MSDKKSLTKTTKIPGNKPIAIEIAKDGKDIREIIYKDLGEGICEGLYGDFNVLMMKINGYFNATDFCQQISSDTGTLVKFDTWLKTTRAKELIEAAARGAGLKPDDLIYDIECNNAKLSGSYIHPDIFASLACWASPDFAVKLAIINNDFFAFDAHIKHQYEIKRKNEKIARLKKQLDDMKATALSETKITT